MYRSPAETARSGAVRPGGRTAGTAAALVAAAAGIALLAGCGTTTAGPAATTGSAPAVTASPTGSTSPRTGGSPAVGTAPAPVTTPSGGGGSTPAGSIVGRVRVPLVLSAGSMPVAGSVTGVVTLGLNRCLFLRTDAGQEFALGGALGARARALLVGRRHPLLPAPDGSPAALTTPGIPGLRVRARGSVSGGASVCSTPFEFTADSGALQDVLPGS